MIPWGQTLTLTWVGQNSIIMKTMANKIITFSCSNLIHIYEPNCGLSPMLPFRSHKDIHSAKEHLESCGKKNIDILIYKNKHGEHK